MTSALACELLRTHINQRAAPSLLSCEHAHGITQTARDTEIRDLQLPPLVDHQIGRFQVAMDDACACVRVIERLAEFACPSAQIKRLENLVGLVAAQPRECLAINI